MYVTDDNILSDVRYQNDDWIKGNLSGLGIRCANYSKLAAETVSNGQQTFICLYYQTSEQNGPITMVSFSERKAGWTSGIPDMTVIPTPTPVHRDPPMYGTSLTAVRPRSGIGPRNETQDVLPVVYLQWDTHSIAHAQGKCR